MQCVSDASGCYTTSNCNHEWVQNPLRMQYTHVMPCQVLDGADPIAVTALDSGNATAVTASSQQWNVTELIFRPQYLGCAEPEYLWTQIHAVLQLDWTSRNGTVRAARGAVVVLELMPCTRCSTVADRQVYADHGVAQPGRSAAADGQLQLPRFLAYQRVYHRCGSQAISFCPK